MSIRGRITCECDQKGCHGEQVIDAEDMVPVTSKNGLTHHAWADGWRMDDNGEFVCPQCVEDAERRDDSHERAAARSRNCDFADNPRHPGRDWT